MKGQINMKYRSSDEIREMFLKFFESKGHSVEPSAPLVPINDNTLLWINSGVAALKKYFDGSVKAKNPRITNVQKSLRTNDIENVGKTARHQTFFEMLGNFSIGDYFKEDAIAYAYEFLFSENWLGLDVNKAYFSVHDQDEEALRIWTQNHNIPESRILKTEDNFWQIGNGPCGPNSEIFYDRGEKYDPENIGEELFFKDLENDRYVEVWNIVFSQYDGVEGEDPSTFKELPQKNIDTGMGFERLVSIVQEVDTNFDTDIFTPILKEIEELSNSKYSDNSLAYRVIADHIRALVFTLSDGAVFSNEGRGYVLRRLLRRAVRYGKVLGIQGLFMNQLAEKVLESMGSAYPYLYEKQEIVKKLIETEEKRFAQTLADGENLLNQAIEELDTNVLAGDVAFKLYDTYGFPIELTQEIASEKNIDVDIDGFNASLEEQKERARKGRHVSESMQSQNEDMLNFTEKSEFVYNDLTLESEIIGMFKDGSFVDTLEGKGYIVTKQTPFYAESGGQVSDKGWIQTAKETLTVEEVSKANGGQHLHKVTTQYPLQLKDLVELHVDEKARLLTRKNHSAVHLLQSALQKVVGDHVQQAGSFVDDKYLRFDFTHFEKVSDTDLKEVEDMINDWIVYSYPIITTEMNLEDAKKTGAMALFSENYGEVVRVVSMGEVSKELCGGTHAINTSEIGIFVIESEESVGSGVRRITASTSINAYNYLDGYKKQVNRVRNFLDLPIQTTILNRLEQLTTERGEIIQKLNALKDISLREQIKEWIQNVSKNDEGITSLIVEVHDFDNKDLKTVIERLNQKVDVIAGINTTDKGIQFMVMATQHAVDKGYKAGDIVKEMALISGGKGGGKPTFAQAGGKNIDSLVDVKEYIKNKMNNNL